MTQYLSAPVVARESGFALIWPLVDTVANLSDVITAGFLTNLQLGGSNFQPQDAFYISYVGGANFFFPTFSGSTITLQRLDSAGVNMVGSAVVGNIPAFATTGGNIQDDGYSPSDPDKSTIAMLNSSVTSDHLGVFSDDNGTLKDGGVKGTASNKDASDNTQPTVSSINGSTVDGNLSMFTDSEGTVGDSGLQANKVLSCAIENPDPNANIVSFSVAVNASALNTTGSVVLYDLSEIDTSSYRIFELNISSNGTNFSGGGGDRNLQIFDGSGTHVYSVIPAATIQSLVNARWGSTNLPFPASFGMSTATLEGLGLTISYEGGTSNYTTGSVIVSGLLVRIS